jgi:hypothetical protein
VYFSSTTWSVIYLQVTSFLWGLILVSKTHHEIIATFTNGDNTSLLFLCKKKLRKNSPLWSIILLHSITRTIFQKWTPNTYALHYIDELPMELTTDVNKICFVASFEIYYSHFISPKLFINPFMTSSWITINCEAIWIDLDTTRPTLVTTSFLEPFATRF